MKIQNKFALIMTLLGLLIVLLLSGGYYVLTCDTAIKKQRQNIASIAEELAHHIESKLMEKTRIAATISSAPFIKTALLKSNSEFAALPDQKRRSEIDRLNQQWIETTEINDPFIQARMANTLADFFRYQQKLIPGEYGEMFLTNRYGVMISTTAKLTTLAHAHKYWWLACVDDGRGRIFLDDRGFDISVQGYVLGVVVPIMDKNEIIGILKCNVNIIGPLTNIVQDFSLRNPNIMKVVRSGGLIVSERGHPPLSTQASGALLESLRHKVAGTTTIAEDDGNQLVAFSPIPITMGSKKIGFGGRGESIDHIKGNKGEGWFIVIFHDEADPTMIANYTTLIIIIVGTVFTLLTALIALLLGRWAAKPIVELASTAKIIGEGSLDARVTVLSTDEIGSLGKSLNQMAKNLKDSMTSRDNLISEVNQRKSTEQALRIEKDNLKNVFESMKDGVYIVSQQYDIQYVNPVLTKEFGAYETLKCYQYLHNRTEVCPWCKAIDVFAGKTIRWEWHSPKNQKDYDLIDSPLKNLDGSISKLEIFRDITEQKKQEEQRLKLNLQQEELKRLESLKIMAGAVAHRFNNSMQSVLGYLELLDMTIADDSPGSEEVSNALQVAKESSQVGSMMLTYLGQRTSQCHLDDMVELTRNVVIELKNQFPSSISLKFTTPSEPLYCSIDSSQIREVISSVFTNAIESLEGAIGTIEITFGTDSYNTDSFPIPFRSDNLEDGVYSFCQISDSGKGINEEDLIRVFDPFFTTKFVGRGLGLALTVGIMRTHHGALIVTSTPGQGTTVKILLPVTTG